ncbi:hypothetical protein LSTR_LSTR003094 [Laodelphax striatellus]|uniref:Uncharacterized protein n=1 Tax=Laodelphax striatellus TaxID=195883 RepID=A0A482WW04_LAOST|nr:hypothetical protein LSTR_LSTR003094 [Laodelphax striatellus]
MEDSSLPKICFIRQTELMRLENDENPKYNWAAQLKLLLSVVDKGELIFSTDVDEWQRNRDSILQAFEIELRNQDLERYNGSASILFRVPRGIADGDAGYFSLHWSFRCIRLMVQLRLATRRQQRKISVAEHCIAYTMIMTA